MSENDIKPVAWMTPDGFEVAHPADATDEYTDPLYDQSAIDRLTAERDAAVADAASLRERMLALEAQRDEFGSREWRTEKSRRKAVAAVNIAYRHLDVESLRVSHCKDLAAIDAARAEGRV